VAAELDQIRLERDALTATGRERHAESITLVARLESLAAERDRLRDSLAALGADRERLTREAGEAVAARGRVEEALAREIAERTRLASALAATQTALAALESAQAEAATRAGEIERLVAERDRLLAERDGRAAVTPAPEPAPHEGLHVVTLTPQAAPRPRPRPAAGQKLVVVLDADATWESIEIGDHAVQVMPPSAELIAEVAAAAPARIVVNLTAPGALAMLAALRAAGSTARFWGCLAYPAGDRALPLGMLEPATRPLEPDAVLETLGHYTTRGTRIVTAGADVDALMSLRQALARRGASVSMAWDAKQAIELLGVVRPDVVLVDLGLPRRDGYGVVAALARVDPLPTAVLVPGPDDMAAGFANVLVDPAHAGRTVRLAKFVGDVVAKSEASAAERRQKIRAVGRK
jgi:CheY-like chemotaxis protein